MMTFSLIITISLVLASPSLRGEVYKYTKGQNTFEIKETDKEYQVNCYKVSGGISSRNKNITDRQLRMDAIDLIGAFILYKDSDIAKDYDKDYFQLFVEGLSFHYCAVLDGVRQSALTINGEPAVCYSCEKDAYKMVYASYNSSIDLASLLNIHYQKDKCEESASLIYKHDSFSDQQYLVLERDFLTGSVRLPSAIRQIQGLADRFEISIISPDDETLSAQHKAAKDVPPLKTPFQQFYLMELLTSAPIKEKEKVYYLWRKLLNPNKCTIEALLDFCAQKCSQHIPKESEATMTSIIEAFPGAISPFGIRRPSTAFSYNNAAQAYANSDFNEAVRILTDAIDIDGITPEMLNLLGASYRLLDQPERAIPYLLLCLKLAPETPFLTGNIFLCMKQLGFPKLKGLCLFLLSFASDNWSVDALVNSK